MSSINKIYAISFYNIVMNTYLKACVESFSFAWILIDDNMNTLSNFITSFLPKNICNK